MASQFARSSPRPRAAAILAWCVGGLMVVSFVCAVIGTVVGSPSLGLGGFYVFISSTILAFVVGVTLYPRRSLARSRWNRYRSALKLAADRLGLTAGSPRHPYRGVISGMTVEANIFAVSAEPTEYYGITVFVFSSATVPRTIEFRPRLPTSGELFKHDKERQLVGDEEFDSAIEVEGPAMTVAALLDDATRARLMEALNPRTLGADDPALPAPWEENWVKDGNVQLSRVWNEPRPELVVQLIETAVLVARSLSIDGEERPAEIRRRIGRLSLEVENPGVRVNLLRLLAKTLPEEPDVKSAAREFFDHPDVETRLAAASVLPGEAVPVLCGIVEDQSLSEEMRLEALEALVDHSEAERVGPLLQRMMTDPSSSVQCASIAALGRFGYAPALDGLLELTLTRDEVAIAAATALGQLRDPRAENVLVMMLKRNYEVRRAAIDALGACGTLSAVEPLLPFAEGGLLDSRLEPEARRALGRIRIRHGRGAPGGLTVAETDEGAGGLSLEDGGAGGRLTIKEQD